MEIKFGERLKELMAERQINAVDLGREISVDPSVIRRWYNHNMDVNLPTLMSLSDYFKCSLEFLAGRVELDCEYRYVQIPKFDARLIGLLKERNITEYRITTDKVFSRNMFFQWKQGSFPRLSSLIKIADYFDCSIDFLVGRE
ncbi:MAG: helix-turn-helix transcriptional regulator [Clostridia bacterium]